MSVYSSCFSRNTVLKSIRRNGHAFRKWSLLQNYFWKNRLKFSQIMTNFAAISGKQSVFHQMPSFSKDANRRQGLCGSLAFVFVRSTVPIRLIAKAVPRSQIFGMDPRGFPSFSRHSPMRRLAQNTLSTCDGRTDSPGRMIGNQPDRQAFNVPLPQIPKVGSGRGASVGRSAGFRV